MEKIKKWFPLGINCLLLFSLIVVLSSCFSPYAEDEATVTISLGGNTAGRMAYGPGEPGYPNVSDLRFEIVFTPTGSSGSRKTITADGPRTDRIRGTVAPGVYDITMNVYLRVGDGHNYLYASTSVTPGAPVLSRTIGPGQNQIMISVGFNADVRGNGTEANPFKVYDEESMKMVGRGTGDFADWDRGSHYILIRDIVLTDNWTPIGINPFTAFYGSFDGNGFTISGLNINSNLDNVGLFGYITTSANSIVKNLRVIGNVTSTGYGAVGGIVGVNQGRVENCRSDVNVSGNDNVGGIVGNNGPNPGGIIQNSYATGSVTGNDSVGGIVGYNLNGGRVVNCYYDGPIITVSIDGGGGIVGANSSPNIVRNSVALNARIDDGNVFMGRIAGGANGTFTNNFGLFNMSVGGVLVSSNNPNDANGANVTLANSHTVGWWTTSTPTGPGWTIHSNRAQSSEASPWYWGGGRPRLWFE